MALYLGNLGIDRRGDVQVAAGGTLASRFDPRRNSLTMLRLGLALVVAYVHALAIGFDWQPSLGTTTVGDLAVDGFFVLSGFLVTRSLLRLDSVRRYAWHRFLRIMPGFWVCLIVTAVLFAPVVAMLEGRPALSVFTAEQDSALDYVVVNAALLMNQFGIAGLPASLPGEPVFDGALWTLYYEAVSYALVAGLGVLGVLRRRPQLLVALVGLLWVLTVLNAAGLEVISQERLLRFTFLFLLGALALVYDHLVPIRAWLALASLAVLVPSLLLLDDYRALGGPAFAYLFLWAVVVLPLRQNPAWDLSYGLYVYHWPVQLVLALLGLTAWGAPVFIAVSVAISLGVAVLSWRFVEGPALGLKQAAWVTGSPRRLVPGRTRPGA